MNYGKLLSDSFKLTWRYKSLWLLGLFVYIPSLLLMGGAAGTFGQIGREPMVPSIDPGTVLAFSAMAFMVMILSFLVQSYATPVLVDAANQIMRGGRYGLADSFGAGARYFLRYLGLQIVGIFIAGGVALLIFIPFLIVMFVLGAMPGGEEMSFLAVGLILLYVLVLIVPMMLVSVGLALAGRSLVVRDANIADCLSEAWRLVKGNAGSALVSVLLILVVAIPVLIVQAILETIIAFTVPDPVAKMFVSLPLNIIVSVLGFVWGSHYFTVLYFELVEPGKAQLPGDAPAPEHPYYP